MKRKISDYLHHYIGQECLVDGRKELLTVGLLAAAGDWNSIKPLLFPASMILEEKMLELVKLHLEPVFTNIDDVQYAAFKGVRGVSAMVHSEGMPSFNIRISVATYIYVTIDGDYCPFNHPEFVRRLLSWGIDMFGLIHSGLAISKKKVAV